MEFLEVPLYDDDLIKLGVRFLFNLFFLTVVVSVALGPNQQQRDFSFTAVLMNIMVFFICFTLKKLDLGLGMALGLFAIFGVLRYRTDAIRAKDMTYLFVVIGIAVINALSNKKTSYAELVAVNSVIVLVCVYKERLVARNPLRRHTVQYDRLDYLGASQRPKLLKDLRKRTGIDVTSVEVRNIDLRKGTATLYIWFQEPKGDPPDAGKKKNKKGNRSPRADDPNSHDGAGESTATQPDNHEAPDPTAGSPSHAEPDPEPDAESTDTAPGS